jgi:hypothetical protein
MKKIKDLLSNREVGKARRIDEKSIESAFFSALQKELPNIGRADIANFKLGNGKIFLRTTHPAIAGEIWKKKEKLKREINDFLGEEILEEIKAK